MTKRDRARLELHGRAVHRYGREEWGWIRRHGFWLLALLWLPAGVVLQAAVRFLPEAEAPPGLWVAGALMAGASLAVAASVFAGLLGPVAIAVCAVAFSAPVWGAWWWLAHSG